MNGRGRCIFKPDNENIVEIGTAVPRLRFLRLGPPCFENTCTVACLLQTSVHCVELQKPEVHFNTMNIIDNLKDISEDPSFQQLRSLPNCTLRRMTVHQLPLTIDGPGFETVACGMVDIFPSLNRFAGLNEAWKTLTKIIRKLQGM